MDREILFRGKNKVSGTWCYGGIVRCNIGGVTKDEIIETKEERDYNYCTKEGIPMLRIIQSYKEVQSNTVGQYTGLNYKNEKDGRKMFEGDVFRRYNDLFVIKVEDIHGYRFVTELADGRGFGAATLTRGDAEYGEYVGNIHDTPELIRGVEK